jgi:hypothetical protein
MESAVIASFVGSATGRMLAASPGEVSGLASDDTEDALGAQAATRAARLKTRTIDLLERDMAYPLVSYRSKHTR